MAAFLGTQQKKPKAVLTVAMICTRMCPLNRRYPPAPHSEVFIEANYMISYQSL